MQQFITTFPRISEFEKAQASLSKLSLSFLVVDPGNYRAAVDTPAIVVDDETRRALYAADGNSFICFGWIEYRPAAPATTVFTDTAVQEDVFGKACIMVLQPCVAAPEKIRFTAHLTGDLSAVFPYMNAIMSQAYYNKNGPTFTFMDGYRMITAYPQRIAVAKADDIVDAWRVCAMIRAKANECWASRTTILPSDELRRKPPALEIYFRLPRTNCGQCGEKACMAFALKLWSGQTRLSECGPVFNGEAGHLKDALVQICAGLDVGQDRIR